MAERRGDLLPTLQVEREVAEWVKDHPALYDKGDERYKDKALRESLWQTKADELRINRDDLVQWYRRQRTTYAKVFGRIRMDLTARQKFVYDNFAFLEGNVYRRRRSGYVPIRIRSDPDTLPHPWVHTKSSSSKPSTSSSSSSKARVVSKVSAFGHWRYIDDVLA